MTNKIGIATMSPIDHLPNIVFGTILQDGLVILSSFPDKKPCIHLILHLCNLLCPSLHPSSSNISQVPSHGCVSHRPERARRAG